MPPLTIMIKPSSSNCNLRCEYCFYADESSNRTTASFGFMHLDTLEMIVKKSLSQAEYSCTFAFQGGEPTLIGLAFYRKLIEFEKKYNKKHLFIQNIIQTNGYVIDDTWAFFLNKNHFLVGLSIDGPEFIHDSFRKAPDGKGTFAQIIKTVNILKKHNVEFNVLTVVTSKIARYPEQVYSFYKNRGLIFQQYIPCLNPLGLSEKTFSYTITPDLYGDFLIRLFDLWYMDYKKGNIVYISFFEDLIGILRKSPPASCTLCHECQKQYVIESNGNIYPCDFYAMDEYLIGNINTNTFKDIDQKRKELQFIEQSQKHPITCSFCKWHFLCNSGCRRERDRGSGPLSTNIFCSAYKRFYAYAFNRLYELSTLH